MEEMELWVDIKGYEGLYQVSNLGRVRSLGRGMYVQQDRYDKPRWVYRKGRVLKEYKRTGKQRQMVALCFRGISKTHSVHRLVALHHVPNPNNYPVVNHRNHNHLDNRASNLEWCTQQYNIRYAIAAGRMDHIYIGSKKLTKISKEQATKAKKLLRLGVGNSNVAKQLGIGYNAVYHIAKGHTWKNI